jgi:hypothetical protein
MLVDNASTPQGCAETRTMNSDEFARLLLSRFVGATLRLPSRYPCPLANVTTKTRGFCIVPKRRLWIAWEWRREMVKQKFLAIVSILSSNFGATKALTVSTWAHTGRMVTTPVAVSRSRAAMLLQTKLVQKEFHLCHTPFS